MMKTKLQNTIIYIGLGMFTLFSLLLFFLALTSIILELCVRLR